jgi:hypothetical protein
LTWPMQVPTVDAERAPRARAEKPPKLINPEELRDRESVPAGASGAESVRRLGFSRAVRFWPRARMRALASISVALALGLAGCGGATAPCPTPTTELDSLRTVSERLENQVDRETAEGRTLEARRDQASRRAAVAEAALDSLAGVRPR